MDTYSPSIPSAAINQTPGSTRKPGSEKAVPDSSETDFAETEAVHSIPQMPVSPQMHLQWGLTLYAQGDTAAALWAFLEGIGSEPENALGHYLCGLAFQALELRQEAKAEWEIVLKITPQDEAVQDEAVQDEAVSGEVPFNGETRWARTLVQRLLDKEASSSPQEAPASASFLGVVAENAGPRTGRGLSAEAPGTSASHQASLEASILEDVRLYGNCYVKDHHIARQLAGANEEQVILWKQSFSARAGLECHLYQKTVEQSDRHEGVIFMRHETSAN